MKVKIIIDRFEGDFAVLKTENNKTINWPIENLPEGASEGSALFFLIGDSPETADSKRELAKDILNEILDTSEN
jgi:hypothetical protein